MVVDSIEMIEGNGITQSSFPLVGLVPPDPLAAIALSLEVIAGWE
jgi:hypothetical protein